MKRLQKIASIKVSDDVPVIQLQVIKGGKTIPPVSNERIQQFWLFCHAALWNEKQFKEEQTVEFHQLIREHFKDKNNHDKTFRQLVERVCLAKRLSQRNKEKLDKPLIWLNIFNPHGLSKTKNDYKQQSKKYSSLNKGVSELSSSLLHYCHYPSLIFLPYHRNRLICLKQFDLLQIFMNTTFHFRFLRFILALSFC